MSCSLVFLGWKRGLVCKPFLSFWDFCSQKRTKNQHANCKKSFELFRTSITETWLPFLFRQLVCQAFLKPLFFWCLFFLCSGGGFGGLHIPRANSCKKVLFVNTQPKTLQTFSDNWKALVCIWFAFVPLFSVFVFVCLFLVVFAKQ